MVVSPVVMDTRDYVVPLSQDALFHFLGYFLGYYKAFSGFVGSPMESSLRVGSKSGEKDFFKIRNQFHVCTGYRIEL